MEKIFTPEFLKEIGFGLISEKISEFKPNLPYGSAKDRYGMSYIYWNENGYSCTYFGMPLEPNYAMSIRKDGDTRTAFNGYVFNQDDVSTVLKLTW